MGIKHTHRDREGGGGCGLTWRTLVLGVLAAKGQGEPPLPAAVFLTGWGRVGPVDQSRRSCLEVCLSRDRVLGDGRRGDHAEDK